MKHSRRTRPREGLTRPEPTPTRERRAVLRSLLASGAVLSLAAGGKISAAPGSRACPTLPEETSGPFPADGSDRGDRGPGPLAADRQHRVPNILAAPGIVRQDIRPSFATSFTIAPGVALRLELTLLDLSRACRPLADSAVYLWNCNRDGDYSLYGRGIEHENYLRGVQFTDHDGRAVFQTIFPACYSGRYPHLHLEVFKQGARLLDASTRVLTSQLTAPREVCSRVYAAAPGYTRSAVQFKGLSPSDDMVFAASSAAELALQTLAVTGDLDAGFIGHATLGIRVPGATSVNS
jgi:protocatechuate 3,4-dioxygenase beta subunit